MRIKFLLQDQPYKKGDVVDWTPDESAERLIAEGKAEAFIEAAAEPSPPKAAAPAKDKMRRPTVTK